jgi:Arc/MetJ-type ribon-helix-helix transcriptional regulator
MYGMRRTTVYLPEELKAALERLAQQRGCSEAELIREAVRSLAESSRPPEPTLPLFTSSDPTLAERLDEALEGFGER